MARDAPLIDFNADWIRQGQTLIVAAEWVPQHCVVPDGFAKGEDFDLVDWQLWALLNFYRLKPTATLGQLAPAFHYRRSQVVLPRRQGRRPTPPRISALRASDPHCSTDGPKAARSGTAATTDAAAGGSTNTNPVRRWPERGLPR